MAFEHAVVLGGGIAGLLAAAALGFAVVTIGSGRLPLDGGRAPARERPHGVRFTTCFAGTKTRGTASRIDDERVRRREHRDRSATCAASPGLGAGVRSGLQSVLKRSISRVAAGCARPREHSVRRARPRTRRLVDGRESSASPS